VPTGTPVKVTEADTVLAPESAKLDCSVNPGIVRVTEWVNASCEQAVPGWHGAVKVTVTDLAAGDADVAVLVGTCGTDVAAGVAEGPLGADVAAAVGPTDAAGSGEPSNGVAVTVGVGA
jgi:hypothetical protein